VNQFSPIKYGISTASARDRALSIRAAAGARADGRALHVRVRRVAQCVIQVLAPLCATARLLLAADEDAQGYAAHAAVVLVAIWHKRSCQDLPSALEEAYLMLSARTAREIFLDFSGGTRLSSAVV
jgi:hypothetical protein